MCDWDFFLFDVFPDVQFAPIHSNGTLGSWTATASFDTERYAPAAVAYNGYLYVMGGFNMDTGYLNDVQYAPINSNGTIGTWIATTGFPVPRYSHSAVVYNGYLYVMGGDGGSYRNDVQFAHINSNGTVGSWTATSSFATGRNGHASVALNNYLYILGGSGDEGYLGDVQYAPINTGGTLGAWTAATSLPEDRFRPTSAACNGRIYVLGGYNGTDGWMNSVKFAAVNAGGMAADIVGIPPSGLPAVTAADLDVCADTGVQITWAQDAANWGDNNSGTRTYDVLRNWTPIAVGLSYGTTTYTDTTGTNGTRYSYRVRFNNGCSFSAMTNSVGSWTATASFTTGRMNHASVIYNGYMYVTGGSSGSNLNDVQFAPINSDGTVDSWTATTSFSSGRYDHAAAAYNGYLYVIGGNDDSTTYADVQYSHLNTNGTVGTWASTTSLPHSLYGHTAFAYNGYLYVTGGYSQTGGGHLDDVQYAPISGNGTIGSWTTVSSFTTARYRHRSAVYNGYLYIMGGDSGSEYLNDVQYAPINGDGTLGSWITAASFNTGRYYFASAAYDGYIYVMGGNSGTALDDVQYAPIKSDGSIGAWITSTSLPAGRFGHGGEAYNGYLYVIGGLDPAHYPWFLSDVQYALLNAGAANAADLVGTAPSGSPAITAADDDACADAGVLITWPEDPGSWNDGGIGTRTYTVLRDGNPIATGITYGTTTYTDTTGTNNVVYPYIVSYTNGCGLSLTSSSSAAADSADLVPCPEVADTLGVSISGANAVISWTAVSCSDLANYRVYGSTGYNTTSFPSGWTILGNPASPTLNDELGSSYRAYLTISVDSCGNMSP